MMPLYITDRRAAAAYFRQRMEDSGLPATSIHVDIAPNGRMFAQVIAPTPASWSAWVTYFCVMAQNTAAKVTPVISVNTLSVIFVLEAPNAQ